MSCLGLEGLIVVVDIKHGHAQRLDLFDQVEKIGDNTRAWIACSRLARGVERRGIERRRRGRCRDE
jgi:hypothetical protein